MTELLCRVLWHGAMTACAHPVLQLKLDQAQIVIDEALDAYPMDAPVIAWSGGAQWVLARAREVENRLGMA